MDLIVAAVPFFILAIIGELAFGVFTGRNTYRLNDSVGSLFLGVLSQARAFVTLGVGGYVYPLVTDYVSLPLMYASSPRSTDGNRTIARPCPISMAAPVSARNMWPSSCRTAPCRGQRPGWCN